MDGGLKVRSASSSHCQHHYQEDRQQATYENNRPVYRQLSSPQPNCSSTPHHNEQNQNHNHQYHRHREQQVQLINSNTVSDSKQTRSSNFNPAAHHRSSSPSDASPMMRAPALYRPDTGDSGGVGPPMAAPHPAAPSCPQLGVGQRTALKLASVAIPQQQQQQQQQHHNRKMPICQRSTWPAGPPPPSSPGQLDYADYDGQQSDECSCSSSIDCLSSPTGHLIEPVGAHQRQHQQHHLHQPPLAHQHHHQHQQHRRQQQQQQHLVERPSDDDCSFIQHHHHHQAFHDHRPLVPQSSVPPYTGSSTSTTQPQQQQQPQQPLLPQQLPQQAPPAHQQAAGQPPPLLRQTTYTATPETVTDSAPAGNAGGGLPIPLTPPPPPGSATTSSNNADMVISGGPSYHTMSRLEQKQQAAHYSKQRQTVSFRRSATADYAADMKQQPDSMLYSDNNDDKSAHKALLHRQRSAGIGLTSANRAANAASQLKQSSLSRITNNNNNNNTTHNNNNNNSNAKSNGQPGGQVRPASLHTTSPLSIVANSSNNHQHQLNATCITPGPVGGAFPPNSPLPNQAMRAGLLAPLTNTFDGVCSLPAVTSHRTNSPWMRISSIILAPIGIIIILFIVVSPLLHYLM